MERLQAFLNEDRPSKSMKKWVDSVIKIVQRKCEPSEQRPITFSFERSPPPIEWHLKVPEEEYGLLTVIYFSSVIYLLGKRNEINNVFCFVFLFIVTSY